MKFYNEYGSQIVDSDAEKIHTELYTVVKNILTKYKPTCFEEVLELDSLIRGSVGCILSSERLKFSITKRKQKCKKEKEHGRSET